MNNHLNKILSERESRNTFVANVYTKKLVSWFSISKLEAVSLVNAFGFSDIKKPSASTKYNSYLFKLEGGLHYNNDGTFELYVFHY